jgi:glycine C-acetyltransferase
LHCGFGLSGLRLAGSLYLVACETGFLLSGEFVKMDIFKRIRANAGALGQWSKQGNGYFMYPKLEGEVGPRMKFRGHDVLNWSVNNYLGLAENDELRACDAKMAEKYGLSYPMGSRLMTGHTKLHEELETVIADFVQKEDAFVLNSFYQGMVSIIDCLCGRNDVIVYDSDVHASIHDGVRLHLGKRFLYQQNKIELIETQLQKACECAASQDGCVLLVTEGVIGLSGELAPLDKIVKLKEKYDFCLVVEDAHGFGTMGPNGIGAADYFGVQDKVDLHIGTFGKAMGVMGGFVAGSEELVNYLRFNMRSQTFSEALPAAVVGSVINRMKYMMDKPELREKLGMVVSRFHDGLRKAGLEIGNTMSPVTPVYMPIHNMQEAVHMMVDLRETYNIFCVMIIYPYIQQDKVLLRFIPTATHTLEDVDYTVESLAKIYENLKAGKYIDNKPISRPAIEEEQ